jgi:hypothetical protein
MRPCGIGGPNLASFQLIIFGFFLHESMPLHPWL